VDFAWVVDQRYSVPASIPLLHLKVLCPQNCSCLLSPILVVSLFYFAPGRQPFSSPTALPRERAQGPILPLFGPRVNRKLTNPMPPVPSLFFSRIFVIETTLYVLIHTVFSSRVRRAPRPSEWHSRPLAFPFARKRPFRPSASGFSPPAVDEILRCSFCLSLSLCPALPSCEGGGNWQAASTLPPFLALWRPLGHPFSPRAFVFFL